MASSRIAAPPPAMIHQPTWLASAKPGRKALQRGEHGGAHHRDAKRRPTCRLVEATAAATPACVRGIPETAAFVIGALTRPKPMPRSQLRDRHLERGGRGERGHQQRRDQVRDEAPTSGRRGPREPTRRPDSGAETRFAAAIGSVSRPACSAV